MSAAPVLWAQRADTLYLTWDFVNARDVKVVMSEKSLTFTATVGDKHVAMQDMALSEAILPAESKWCVQAIIKKAEKKWWEKLNADRAFKPYVKADWSRWVEEDDPAYNGSAVAGMDWSNGVDYDESDSDDDDAPLDDLNPGPMAPEAM